MSSPDQKKDAALVNPPVNQTRMVKIKAKTPIRTMRKEGSMEVEHIHQPGSVIEVTEEEAKEFCDKKISIGHKGQGFGNFEKQTVQERFVVRAERVK